METIDRLRSCVCPALDRHRVGDATNFQQLRRVGFATGRPGLAVDLRLSREPEAHFRYVQPPASTPAGLSLAPGDEGRHEWQAVGEQVAEGLGHELRRPEDVGDEDSPSLRA